MKMRDKTIARILDNISDISQRLITSVALCELNHQMMTNPKALTEKYGALFVETVTALNERDTKSK